MVSPPDWLSQFVDAITVHFHSHDSLSPLGCHFQQVQDVWEITVFASRTEIVGGAQDGQMCNSCFSVDVTKLLKVFTTVETISWQAQPLGPLDDLGSHLSIEGTREGRQVWLRITATSPEQFGVGRRAIVNQREIEEIW